MIVSVGRLILADISCDSASGIVEVSTSTGVLGYVAARMFNSHYNLTLDPTAALFVSFSAPHDGTPFNIEQASSLTLLSYTSLIVTQTAYTAYPCLGAVYVGDATPDLGSGWFTSALLTATAGSMYSARIYGSAWR
jgi:hypothetical protein